MSDSERLESLEALFNSGVIGIDGDSFIIDQTALLSAMEKTDRLLLLRIVSKLEGKKLENLMTEAIDSDIRNLTQLLESTQKMTK